MTGSTVGSHRYARVEVDRAVTVVYVERRELVRRDTRMVNVGLGGCVVTETLPSGAHVAVLVHEGLFVVGRAVADEQDGSTRIEWVPDDDAADDLVDRFALPVD
jgi:hypothetical protein